MSSSENIQPRFIIGQRIITSHGHGVIIKMLELPNNPDEALMKYLGAETPEQYNDLKKKTGNVLYTVNYDFPYAISNFSFKKFEEFTISIGIGPIKLVPFLKKYRKDEKIFNMYQNMRKMNQLDDIEIKNSGEEEEKDLLRIHLRSRLGLAQK
jgi:hypothetical protein